MKRYQGEGLPASPRIAVIANDAIGNFVVATPLLQMLRRELEPSMIHYFGGKRTLELQEASDLFERHFPLHGTSLRESAALLISEEYDLVVNVENSAMAKAAAAMLAGPQTFVCGPSLDAQGRRDLPFPADERGDLWRDQAWIAEDLASRYPFLSSGFIGEIYVRLCYLEGPVPPYRVPIAPPNRETPDVLIAASASLPDKLWPAEKWTAALEQLASEGYSIGLLGAKPSVQREHWRGDSCEDLLVERGLVQDLRGAFTLPQVAGALGECRLCLTLDNGILHLAAAVGAPTVGLFRFGIHRLWAPPVPSVKPVVAGEGQAVAEIPVHDVVERSVATLRGTA
jgi:heptosyltransferase III